MIPEGHGAVGIVPAAAKTLLLAAALVPAVRFARHRGEPVLSAGVLVLLSLLDRLLGGGLRAVRRGAVGLRRRRRLRLGQLLLLHRLGRRRRGLVLVLAAQALRLFLEGLGRLAERAGHLRQLPCSE